MKMIPWCSCKRVWQMAMPYETPLQLRIITCLFVACSWKLVWSCLELELELDLNSSWTFCLGVLVQVFVSPCTFLWACVPCVFWCACPFLFCALLFGLHELPVQELLWNLMQRKPKTAALEGLAKAMQPDATMLSSTCTRHTLQCLDKGSAKLSY